MHNKTSLILSLFLIFSSSSYSQNYNFSIEAGFGTSHSLNPLTINSDSYDEKVHLKKVLIRVILALILF